MSRTAAAVTVPPPWAIAWSSSESASRTEPSAARAISDEEWRSQALAAVAPHLADPGPVLAEALAAAQPGAFDVVTCMEMLEHVPDPQAVIAALAQRLAGDGDDARADEGRRFFLRDGGANQKHYAKGGAN